MPRLRKKLQKVEIRPHPIHRTVHDIHPPEPIMRPKPEPKGTIEDLGANFADVVISGKGMNVKYKKRKKRPKKKADARQEAESSQSSVYIAIKVPRFVPAIQVEINASRTLMTIITDIHTIKPDETNCLSFNQKIAMQGVLRYIKTYFCRSSYHKPHYCALVLREFIRGKPAYNKPPKEKSCIGCNTTKNLTRHHVVRESRGGSSLPLNLITLCRSCHDEVEERIDAFNMQKSKLFCYYDYAAIVMRFLLSKIEERSAESSE